MSTFNISTCCLNAFHHEGVSKGTYSIIGGLDSYQTGLEFGDEKIIVILTDIFGYKLNNALLLADQLSQIAQSQVVIPDILEGDAVEDKSTFEKAVWGPKHSVEKTGYIVENFLKNLLKEKPIQKLYGIGFCFGAKFVVQQLSKHGLLDAGAIAHPSMLTTEDIEEISKPILISTGDLDSAFPEEFRNLTTSILTKKRTLRFQLDLFQGCPHGYAVRGDISVPEIKYAKEKTLIDQAFFFTGL